MKRSSVIALAVLLSCRATLAQEMPVVRVAVEPATVAVGESAQLQVTVLVPTWFPQPPVYPDFELANAITRLPPDSSFPTSERIGRDNWSGIVRNYRIYPLTGATFRITGEQIGVTWANPGSAPNRQEVKVPDIEFRATVPAGAEGLDPYIAGSALSLAMTAEGETSGLEAGDALVLRYTAELDGLPAIFLPPLAPAIEIDGVSVYADAPEIDDGPPARRTERVTLVFNAGGSFTVPGISLYFWNTTSGRIDTAAAQGLSLAVAGPPAESMSVEAEGTAVDWRMLGLALAALVAAGAAAWRWLPAWRARIDRARRRRRESEAHAFHELSSALRAGHAEEAYRKMLEWTGRLEPPIDSDEFARRFGDESLRRSLVTWRAGLFAGGAERGNPSKLAAELVRARARYLERGQKDFERRLPPLNPA